MEIAHVAQECIYVSPVHVDSGLVLGYALYRTEGRSVPCLAFHYF